jgi:hypothetical protein
MDTSIADLRKDYTLQDLSEKEINLKEDLEFSRLEISLNSTTNSVKINQNLSWTFSITIKSCAFKLTNIAKD